MSSTGVCAGKFIIFCMTERKNNETVREICEDYAYVAIIYLPRRRKMRRNSLSLIFITLLMEEMCKMSCNRCQFLKLIANKSLSMRSIKRFIKLNMVAIPIQQSITPSYDIYVFISGFRVIHYTLLLLVRRREREKEKLDLWHNVLVLN
jgi:hypothetical protein